MKNSLSENMLRFGTKNLSESAKQQLLRLTEAPEAAGGYDPFLSEGGQRIPGALKFKDAASWDAACRTEGGFVNFIKNDTWVTLAKSTGINMFTTAGDADKKWWGNYSFGTSAQDIWDPKLQVELILNHAYSYIIRLCFGLGIKDLSTVASLERLLNAELPKKPGLAAALEKMHDDDVYKTFSGFKKDVLSMKGRGSNPVGNQKCWETINRALIMMWNPGFRNVFTPGYNLAVSQYTVDPKSQKPVSDD